MPQRKRSQRNHISTRQRADAVSSFAQYVKQGGPKKDLERIKMGTVENFYMKNGRP